MHHLRGLSRISTPKAFNGAGFSVPVSATLRTLRALRATLALNLVVFQGLLVLEDLTTLATTKFFWLHKGRPPLWLLLTI